LILDLQPLVQLYNVGPLALYRTAPPTRNEFGESVVPSSIVITLNPVSVHPVNGKELEQLREADRTKEVTKFYTLVRTYVSDGFSDVVTWSGRNWKISNVSDFSTQGGVYISLGVLLDVQIT